MNERQTKGILKQNLAGRSTNCSLDLY